MLSRIILFLFFPVACVLWALLVGKDLGWDIYNHHLYLPFAWMEGRLIADLFAAGPQSYQNPLGFFPFYFMVKWQWPAWLVGCALALIHSLNCLFLIGIADTLWRKSEQRDGWVFGAVLVAWSAPIFLFVVGSSTVDAIGSAMVLCALMLLLRPQAGSVMGLCIAGVLLALAFSVKQSNAVFVLATAIVMVWQWLVGQRAFSELAICGGGVLVGLLLGMGWYSWVLWSHFGNPVFPLYNNIFESPYAAPAAVVAGRFMPTDLWSYVVRVWDVALMKRFIYFEGFAPDIRPLLLLLLAGALGGILLFRRLVHREVALKFGWLRQDTALLIFIIASYVLWLLTSGNGRYAIPLFLLVGLVLVRWAFLFLPRLARGAVLLVVCLQMGYTVTAADLRFSTEPWDAEQYFKVDVSQRLRDEPFLHLSLGIQSHASLTFFLNHKGLLINPIGQMSLPFDDSPLGLEFKKRLSEWKGRTRIIVSRIDRGNVEVLSKTERRINELIYRLGLVVDLHDCEDVSVRLGLPESNSLFAKIHSHNMFIQDVRSVDFSSCAVVEGAPPNVELDRTMDRADKVFSIMESQCPGIYSPPGFASDRGLDDWRRFYPNSDASVLVSERDGVVVQSPRSPVDRFVGSIDEILRGRGQFDCKRWSLIAPD